MLIFFISCLPDVSALGFLESNRFPSLSQLTDDLKKEKEKEPEKAEKQETAVLRKKGFEEEKKDSDDSDEV